MKNIMINITIGYPNSNIEIVNGSTSFIDRKTKKLPKKDDITNSIINK